MFQVAGGMLAASAVQSMIGYTRELASEALTAYANYERLGMALTTLSARELVNTGQYADLNAAMGEASEMAQELLGWVEHLAVKSPFNQSDIAQSFRMALAYNFTTEQAQALTEATTDFAAGSGATGEALKRITLALGQINAKGRVSGEEMRQLTEAGLGAGKILADAFGVTQAELVKMIEKGAVPADAAIQAIVNSLNKDFGGAAERQANTFSGLVSSLQDVKEIGLRDLFGGTFQAIQPYLIEFVDFATNPAVREGIRKIGQDIGQWVGGNLKKVADASKRFYEGYQEGGLGQAILNMLGFSDLGQVVKAVQDKFTELQNSIINYFTQGGIFSTLDQIRTVLGLDQLAASISASFSTINWVDYTPVGFADKYANWAADLIESADWTKLGLDFAALVDQVSASITGTDWSAVGTAIGEFFNSYVDLIASLFGAGLDENDTEGKAKSGFTRLYTAIMGAWDEIPWDTIGISFQGLLDSVQTAFNDAWLAFDATTGISGAVTRAGDEFNKQMKYFGGQGFIDDIAANIEKADWSGMSVDWSKAIDQMATNISETDWSALGTKFGDSIKAVFSGEGSTISWDGVISAVQDAWGQIKWDQLVISLEGLSSAIQTAFDTFFGGLKDSLGLNVTAPTWSEIFQWPSLESLTPNWSELITWPSITGPDWGNLIHWPSIGEILEAIKNAILGTGGEGERSAPGSNSGNFSRKPIEGTNAYKAGFAKGVRNFVGGFAVVGEEGPELVRLPGGSDVFSNPDSLRMLRDMGLPGFADGTTSYTPPNSGLFYQGDLGTALTGGAKELNTAAKAFKSAVSEFRSMLGSVPGLFGTSSVTKDQMDLAALGVDQNFADDYLRRLTDEVMNGVDWEGIDIGDAAQRAGLDPSLPAEAILKMFTQAWQDSSLFSDPNNLDLINQGAVKSALERQQQSEMGKMNLAELFGIPPDEQAVQMQNILGGMIAGITPEAAAPLGQKLMTEVAAGIGTEAATNGAKPLTEGLSVSISLPASVQNLYDTGLKAAGYIWNGITDGLGGLELPPITPPSSGGGGDSGGGDAGAAAAGGVTVNVTVPTARQAEALAQRVSDLNTRRNRV